MNPQQIVTLSLTVQQVNTILSALGKQPLEAVIDVFAAVREQTSRQLAAEPSAVNGSRQGFVEMHEKDG